MRQMTVNEFRSNLKTSVDAVIESHVPLRITRRSGEDFVVVSAEDWESEQETLHVLQNQSLMEQIGKSLRSMAEGTGYSPAPEELDALDHL